MKSILLLSMLLTLTGCGPRCLVRDLNMGYDHSWGEWQAVYTNDFGCEQVRYCARCNYQESRFDYK